ncbi:uncharacterized protein Z519_05419 [Cladophialophora bantiana CBS 173.52]|uniref:Uncharacterized protein n=1 Tax=Cladophialophora bantiana (strain ATCC 10958 / CBS 173.52 / CDC B-1940 / NIH 8579) TaxID=1442370 RepID=A0A0D2HLE3_CLAB1|nr:uncharacterized protein Z519_05419 [Cladophialophora bantiana CBS 173.52]KIW94103.1 hypothetical protein Z519_05419 [Cladophialophora bantiana CBS 173.52]
MFGSMRPEASERKTSEIPTYIANLNIWWYTAHLAAFRDPGHQPINLSAHQQLDKGGFEKMISLSADNMKDGSWLS